MSMTESPEPNGQGSQLANQLAAQIVTPLQNIVVKLGLILQNMPTIPISRGQYPGTQTNDNAAAGNIGEFVESFISDAAAVAIAGSATPQNLTSISLTAGDWDVAAQVVTKPAGATTSTFLEIGINTVTGTFPDIGRVQESFLAPGAGNRNSLCLARQRVSLAVTTTIFLVVESTFAVSTMAASGFINARRVR